MYSSGELPHINKWAGRFFVILVIQRNPKQFNIQYFRLSASGS